MPPEENEIEAEETDPVEELKEEIANLQSDVIFSAFVSLGKNYIHVTETRELVYDKTMHLAAFSALTASYEDFSQQEMAKSEIQDLTGERD